MAKPSQILSSLKKLYEKRTALNEQITAAEEKLVAEVESKIVAEAGTSEKPIKANAKKETSEKEAVPAKKRGRKTAE